MIDKVGDAEYATAGEAQALLGESQLRIISRDGEVGQQREVNAAADAVAVKLADGDLLVQEDMHHIVVHAHLVILQADPLAGFAIVLLCAEAVEEAYLAQVMADGEGLP